MNYFLAVDKAKTMLLTTFHLATSQWLNILSEWRVWFCLSLVLLYKAQKTYQIIKKILFIQNPCHNHKIYLRHLQKMRDRKKKMSSSCQNLMIWCLQNGSHARKWKTSRVISLCILIWSRSSVLRLTTKLHWPFTETFFLRSC